MIGVLETSHFKESNETSSTYASTCINEYEWTEECVYVPVGWIHMHINKYVYAKSIYMCAACVSA